jgi:hypothetical protein
MPRLDSFERKHLIAVCTLALAACGGGGGSSGPSPAPAPSLTLSGVAAVGAALANAPVRAKCGSGTGSAVTAADGSFTIKIVGGALPCVLEAAPAGSGKLHSVIDGASSGNADVNVNCNVTPLTELVVAKAAGGAPADLFANFDAAAQAKVGTAALDAAVASVAAALQGVIDLNGVDPIKDTLVVGNALDQKLDTLQLVLSAAQTTLSELAAAVATSGTGSPVIQALLQPASATCASLRSGKYRAILAFQAVGAGSASVLLDIDAAALTSVSAFNPTPVALTPVADEPCMFTSIALFESASDTLLVSKSGMGVLRSLSSTGQMRTRYLIPEQILPLSELAGNWNLLEYWPDDITRVYAPGAGTITFDANGNFTDILECTGLGSCVPGESNPGSLQVLEAGGFGAVGSTEGTVAFAFKTASGQMSIFLVNPTIGGFIVGTKQAALSLPAVGDVSNLWNFTIGSNSFASALSAQNLTVGAVDAVAGSYSRVQASDGRIDSFTINSPRNGLRYRAAGSSPVNGVGTATFNEIIAMPLADTGILFYTSVNAADNFFGISVGKP